MYSYITLGPAYSHAQIKNTPDTGGRRLTHPSKDPNTPRTIPLSFRYILDVPFRLFPNFRNRWWQRGENPDFAPTSRRHMDS